MFFQVEFRRWLVDEDIALVFVEGCVGAGKSTFMNRVRVGHEDEMCCFYEEEEFWGLFLANQLSLDLVEWQFGADFKKLTYLANLNGVFRPFSVVKERSYCDFHVLFGNFNLSGAIQLDAQLIELARRATGRKRVGCVLLGRGFEILKRNVTGRGRIYERAGSWLGEQINHLRLTINFMKNYSVYGPLSVYDLSY